MQQAAKRLRAWDDRPDGPPGGPPTVEQIEWDLRQPTPWTCGWSFWIGVYYGPVPVGLILVALSLAIWR